MQKELLVRLILTALWMFLWESFDLVQFVIGFLLATGVTRLFAHVRDVQTSAATRPGTVIVR